MYEAMVYVYFSQTSPSLPPDGVEVDTVMFLTTVELVGAEVTTPEDEAIAPIPVGVIASTPPTKCCTACNAGAAPIDAGFTCGVPKDSH
jgi:hypothetical protein